MLLEPYLLKKWNITQIIRKIQDSRPSDSIYLFFLYLFCTWLITSLVIYFTCFFYLFFTLVLFHLTCSLFFFFTSRVLYFTEFFLDLLFTLLCFTLPLLYFKLKSANQKFLRETSSNNVTVRRKILVHLCTFGTDQFFLRFWNSRLKPLTWKTNDPIVHVARIVIKWRSSNCHIPLKELNKPFGPWVNDLLIFQPVSPGRVCLQYRNEMK